MKYILSFLFAAFIGFGSVQAQEINPLKGYSNDIGVIVAMMDDLKKRITNSVINLDQKETDFLLDKEANRIGAMIMHLAATEKYYQVYTFEGRGFNKKEEKIWGAAMNLGGIGRKELKGKPMSFYLEQWDEIRKESKRLLKTKDDKWFASKVGKTNMNNHWAWYHVMEHQSNHMGQIRLIIKRMN